MATSKAAICEAGDAVQEQMPNLMTVFEVGLFAGDNELAQILDNLDLAQFFRLP